MLDICRLLSGEDRRLSYITRYSSIPTIKGENVAEHLFFVSYYSLILSVDLRHKGHDIDIGKMLAGALLHDLGEFNTGDIIRTFKYHNDKLANDINSITEDMLFGYFDSMGGDNSTALREMMIDKGDGLHGKILHFADIFSIMAYGIQEFRLGNVNIRSILIDALRRLEDKFTDDGLFGEYVVSIIGFYKKENII